MVPLLRMLEWRGLSLTDAEAAGFNSLSQAAQRCQRCLDAEACARWLKWRGRYGRPPRCPNTGFFDQLQGRFRPG